MIPVMIVEDEFLVRVGLSSMIDWEKYGFSIVADAPSGEKGLELYRQHKPYLILTDIRMSPMDGLEMMRRIREMDPGVKFIVISAYSEFEYAQQAIRHGVELYLNKSCFTAEDLEPVLKRLSTQYRQEHETPKEQDAMAEDALSTPPPTADGAALAEWFGVRDLLDKPKVVAVCRTDRRAEQVVSRSVLIAVIRDTFEKAGFSFCTFTREQFIVALIDDTDAGKVEKSLQRLCDTVGQYFTTEFYVGVSARFTKPSYIQQALSDACKTCNDFLFDKSVNLRYFQREILDSSFDKQLSRICEEVQSRLYAADQNAVCNLIRSAIGSATNYRTLERTVFSLIISMERFDQNILVSRVFEDVMSDDIDEICRSLIRWAQNLCREKEAIPEKDSVDEILEYIRNHIQEDITLVRMAEMYYFSPNYLGQLFRQKTGIYFNTYVANLRINRACELLINTDYSVGVIGKMVGIDDPHYFSRTFKARMGVSPNQYRSRHSREEK